METTRNEDLVPRVLFNKGFCLVGTISRPDKHNTKIEQQLVDEVKLCVPKVIEVFVSLHIQFQAEARLQHYNKELSRSKTQAGCAFGTS